VLVLLDASGTGQNAGYGSRRAGPATESRRDVF
jgi:hypothetical protein